MMIYLLAIMICLCVSNRTTDTRIEEVSYGMACGVLAGWLFIRVIT